MSHTSTALSPECQKLEHHLSALLARVERRQQAIPAVAGDGEINKILRSGLRDTLRLTEQFMAACTRGYSQEYQARKLSDFAHGMHQVVAMVHALEGEKQLSPLFDRIANREYVELKSVVFQMRDVVYADSARLNKQAAEPPSAPASEPLVLACTLIMMPALLTWGLLSGFAAGLRESAAAREAQAKPARHLKLVHS
ncbi:MAG: hypothetical protein NDJ24_10140 [Alphaproteobacteria bacterium]|nr:hypothetical protein [Alphaproteobacteria bacterium]